MYRAPACSNGATGFLMLIFLLWGALYVGGCTDMPSDPGFDDLPPMGDVEIEMATDPDLTAALIEDVSSCAIARDAAGQVLRAMRDGESLRRVRHEAGPGRPDTRPDARPVPQGSDPTRTRTPG